MTAPRDMEAVYRAFARVFTGPDGDLVLRHLRAITKETVLGPNIPDAQLRHHEGARCLVHTIETLTERGQHD